MNLSKIELYQKMEEIIERIGKDQFIDDLFDAMNSNELQENFEYIDRCNDSHVFNSKEKMYANVSY